jgi:hypothetical protein
MEIKQKLHLNQAREEHRIAMAEWQWTMYPEKLTKGGCNRGRASPPRWLCGGTMAAADKLVEARASLAYYCAGGYSPAWAALPKLERRGHTGPNQQRPKGGQVTDAS